MFIIIIIQYYIESKFHIRKIYDTVIPVTHQESILPSIGQDSSNYFNAYFRDFGVGAVAVHGPHFQWRVDSRRVVENAAHVRYHGG
jgi:hypothetical protein